MANSLQPTPPIPLNGTPEIAGAIFFGLRKIVKPYEFLCFWGEYVEVEGIGWLAMAYPVETFCKELGVKHEKSKMFQTTT